MAVKLLLEMMLLLVLVLLFLKQAFAQNWRVARPGCPEKCGSVVISYPFGIGKECALSNGFEIYCNNSLKTPILYLMGYTQLGQGIYVEVLNISVEAGTVRINYPITKDCTNTSTVLFQNVLSLYPFTLSDTENRFTAMGCDNLALLTSMMGVSSSWESESTVAGCVSWCNISSVIKDNSCFGINCCQTSFGPFLSTISMPISLNPIGSSQASARCSEGPRYGFIVDRNWFGKLDDIYSVQTMETVPIVLNIDNKQYPLCKADGQINIPDHPVLCGMNASCIEGLCSCRKGYEGNPYLPEGCTDIDECSRTPAIRSTDGRLCDHTCTNTLGSYTCSCRYGWVIEDDHFFCRKIGGFQKVKKAAIVVIGKNVSCTEKSLL